MEEWEKAIKLRREIKPTVLEDNREETCGQRRSKDCNRDRFGNSFAMKQRGVDTLHHPGASVWDLSAMAVAPSADVTSSVPEGALVQPNDPRERLD